MTKYFLMGIITIDQASSWSKKDTWSIKESLHCSICSGLQVHLSNTVYS